MKTRRKERPGVHRGDALGLYPYLEAPRKTPVRLSAVAVGSIIAALVALPVYRQGVLTGLDLLALGCILPILAGRWADAKLKRLAVLALLWWLGQGFSDIYHGSKPVSFISIAGVLACGIAGILVLYRDKFKIQTSTALVPLALGWLILELVVGHAAASGNPWKSGIGQAVSVLLLSIAYAKGANNRTIAAICAALGFVSFYFDCRFFTGIFVFTIVMLTLRGSRAKVGESRAEPERSKRRSGHPTLVMVGAVGICLFLAYPSMARDGVVGERAQNEQVTIDAANANYLLANRPEMLQAAYLFAKNPLLGVGADRTLPASEAYAALEFTQQFTRPLDVNTTSYLLGGGVNGGPFGNTAKTGYASHSQALNAAMHAGVAALPFWGYYIFHIIRMMRFQASLPEKNQGALPALVYVMGLWSLWDSLFSPISARTHLTIAMMVFLLCAIATTSRSTTRKS